MSYIVQAEANQIDISEALMYLIVERAKLEKVSPDEFLSKVLTSANYEPIGDPWGPVPPWVAERWAREQEEFEEEEKQGRHKGFDTVEALMADLDS